jgi:hypothetical protein
MVNRPNKADKMNQTSKEARDRVWAAMRNSLAGCPSLEYLDELKTGLEEWIVSINFLILNTNKADSSKQPVVNNDLPALDARISEIEKRVDALVTGIDREIEQYMFLDRALLLEQDIDAAIRSLCLTATEATAFLHFERRWQR